MHGRPEGWCGEHTFGLSELTSSKLGLHVIRNNDPFIMEFVRRARPRVRLVSQMDGGGHERGNRSGTLNVAGIVGFAKACEIMMAEGDSENARVRKLRDRLRQSLILILTLVLALSYSGRWDISQAVARIGKAIKAGTLQPEDITETNFGDYLSTAGMPDPELLIRTSGEMRISNFLLWQLAYTELYITDLLWPDFRKRHLLEAILAYQKRDRRYGGINQPVIAGR